VEWVRAHAQEHGVTYVTGRARIWDAGAAGWKPYHHVSGATDPANLRMDNVHVSVAGNVGRLACGVLLIGVQRALIDGLEPPGFPGLV
jgi:hypothetical protein